MRIPIELNQTAEFDVLGFGTNAVDFLIETPEYPKFNSKIEVNHYTKLPGGEVATTLVGLSRLGCKTSYVGRFGKDADGDFVMEHLQNEGIDLSFSEQIEGAKTQIAFIIIDQRNGERTVIWQRDSLLRFSADEILGDWTRRAKILHLTPHDLDAAIVLAKAARKCGVIVSIDIDQAFSGVEELLSNVDILISSENFPKEFVGSDDPEAALEKIQSQFGCALTGMTLGDKGSLVYCNGEFLKTEALRPPGGCQDTTGAGDSFRAGFLYGLLNGKSMEETMRVANGVAALKCREIGAQTSLPNNVELTNFLGGYH